ncbi:ribose 5-phosphate isomerase B [Sanyastnella coralliicola]|uniref:ribose 5-phosphate isomerase B n=1 Tax=Sanyastnella coralliicola TaxID=3069118 RepID=UPI0027B9AA32|nr:ribose 5-phosphate isomerase B [Longitalea sp. SCSIO 12813]
MKVAIGADHAGYERKDFIKEVLSALGHEADDKGTHSGDSVDYPDFAHPTAEAVESGDAELGVLICGSAQGVAMTANKHQGIRAAVCWTPEIAALARQHNNANICCIPARFVDEDVTKEIIETFFKTDFEGGRHDRRVGKIACS